MPRQSAAPAPSTLGRATPKFASETFELAEDSWAHPRACDGRWLPSKEVDELRQDMAGPGALSFDEARLQLVLTRMAQAGADPTGMPTDPKAFTLEHSRPMPIRALAAAADEAGADAAFAAATGAMPSFLRRLPSLALSATADGHAAVRPTLWLLMQGLWLVAIQISIALLASWHQPPLPAVLTQPASNVVSASFRGAVGGSNISAAADAVASLGGDVKAATSTFPAAADAAAAFSPPHGF